MWPGLKLQLLTTREPDLDQLEVAIASLQAVLALETPASSRPPTCRRRGRRLTLPAPRALAALYRSHVIEELVRQIETRFAELASR